MCIDLFLKHFFNISLCINGRSAAISGGGDGLLVAEVFHVAGDEHAFGAGFGVFEGLNVAFLIE